MPYRFHKSAHTPDDATMIGNLLQDVKDQATQLLDYPVNITAISLPRDIGLGPHRDLTATIIASNATAVRYEWEFREFLHTARLAYGLDTCRALGISEAADCDLMDETAVILFVDYGLDGRLNLYAGLVGETDVDTDDSELYQRGRHGEFVVVVMAGGKEEDDEGAQKDAVEDLRRILDGFIQEQILGPGDAQYLRAIIISGDASEAAIDTLKKALQLAVPEDWRPLVRDQVDPFWVGAVGAARRAKMHIVDPRYNITAFEEWLQDLARMHDEL
ncbi:uncharacterized protein BO66DRAFT_464430 [Aspergillus aculeatinus CBS 121060]|uniref:Uncharacterized protein n=1 Tax=Aspergillus aculeatinus CBS 121060 TaxID=1448322 RepID=A0ACD1HHH5_9EURO|nr:hypothetical protein BO66DRAFT_464430 [Aspergillus aculeatinus CBS 121060]RAH73253.1 hypothetical protein BO66DRAFT_464430 [Aspergillus aculeatinus CBS 121060]